MSKTADTSPNPVSQGALVRKRLADLLVERKDVRQAEMDKALEIQRSVGGKLDGVLIRTGTVSEDLLLERLAELQGATYLRDAEDLPDSREVRRFVLESPIKRGMVPRQRRADVAAGWPTLLYRA